RLGGQPQGRKSRFSLSPPSRPRPRVARPGTAADPRPGPPPGTPGRPRPQASPPRAGPALFTGHRRLRTQTRRQLTVPPDRSARDGWERKLILIFGRWTAFILRCRSDCECSRRGRIHEKPRALRPEGSPTWSQTTRGLRAFRDAVPPQAPA